MEDVLSFDELNNIDVDGETFVDSVITDDVSDFEFDLDVEVTDKEAEEYVFAATMKSQQHESKLKFWKVHVDEGNLSKFLQGAYHDVEVRQFSLPTWNFELPEQQAAFRRVAERRTSSHHGDPIMSALVTYAEHELQDPRSTGIAQGLARP